MTGQSSYQAATHIQWWQPAPFFLVVIAGLWYVKWQPYYGKAFTAAETHSIGKSILAQADANPWQAALDYAMIYFLAVWKAAVLGVILGSLIQVLIPRDWLLRTLGQSRFRGTLLGTLFSLPGMMCTCCAAPVAAGMRRQQVSMGGALAFWMGNPLLNPATLVFMGFVLGWGFAAFVLAAALALTGCSAGSFLHFGKGSGGSTVQKIDRPAVESAELQFAHPAAGDTIAVFDTSAGVFKAVLFPDKAPQAYDNFAGLVQAGYYNGLTFSRVESGFVVEAGQGADGRGNTIWNGSRYPAETTDSLHHYSGALCMGTDASGECASVFYVMQTLPGDQSVTQELVDQMNSAGYRAEVVSAYQTVGGAPYLDYTDTVLGQVYEGMDVVDAIGQTAVDENQKPCEDITINSVSIETYQ